MTPTHWLDEFLDFAIAERMCTKCVCATCGARAFRDGLHAAFKRVHGLEHALVTRQRLQQELVIALARLERPALANWEREDAVRCILFDLDRVGALKGTALTGSWARDVLESMKVHEANIITERIARVHHESPEEVERRRAEKKGAAAERHAARLAAKVERDRVWHAGHGTSAPKKEA